MPDAVKAFLTQVATLALLSVPAERLAAAGTMTVHEVLTRLGLSPDTAQVACLLLLRVIG